MDLFDVVRSCARRWYVFRSAAHDRWLVQLLRVQLGEAGLLLECRDRYRTAERTDPIFESGVPSPRNGLLDAGGAPLIANLTALGLTEPSVVDHVVAAGGLPGYSANMFPVPANAPPLPLIMIEANNADPDAVSKTLELVVAQAEGTLRTLQQDARVPDDQMVIPFIVSPPSTPAPGMPSRTRSTVAIFVAGLGLSVVVTVLIDVLLGRRRRRIKARPQATSAAEGPSQDRTPSDVLEPDGVVGVNESAMDASENLPAGQIHGN